MKERQLTELRPKTKMAAESTPTQAAVIKGSPMKYVKLNIGGSLYYTTIGTLTRKPCTMLEAMFSGRMEVLADSEGMYGVAKPLKSKAFRLQTSGL